VKCDLYLQWYQYSRHVAAVEENLMCLRIVTSLKRALMAVKLVVHVEVHGLLLIFDTIYFIEKIELSQFPIGSLFLAGVRLDPQVHCVSIF
jgi:hypothetical protein